MRDTTGYIYFTIATEQDDFNLDKFNKYLTLKPTKLRRKFENGKTPISTSWEYSSGNLINPDCYEEIEKLLDRLEPHQTEFQKLKNDFPELYFVLEVVLYMGSETPALHFSQRVIKFISFVNGSIDCDIYPEY